MAATQPIELIPLLPDRAGLMLIFGLMGAFGGLAGIEPGPSPMWRALRLALAGAFSGSTVGALGMWYFKLPQGPELWLLLAAASLAGHLGFRVVLKMFPNWMPAKLPEMPDKPPPPPGV